MLDWRLSALWTSSLVYIHTQAYAVKAVAPYTRMFRTIELKLRVLCSYVRVDMYLRTIPYSFFLFFSPSSTLLSKAKRDDHRYKLRNSRLDLQKAERAVR